MLSDRRFRLLLILIAALYLALQALYIAHNPLVMDEFDGAAEAFRVSHAVPYRDFQPYKTILGYYAQLPPVLLATDVWTSLMLSKIQMALFNAVMLFFTGIRLRKYLRPEAVLLALLSAALMSTYLERSSDIRVDMLTAWCGLASLLLLMERRYIVSGLFCGLSFLVSQKGALYVVAANASMIAWFAIDRWREDSLKNIARFNVAVVAIVSAYLAFWSLLASPARVLDATFFSHMSDTAFGQIYDIRGRYWSQTLFRNPFFWALAVVALWTLEQRRRARGAEYQQLTIQVYAASILAMGIWYRQPWPYFFVIILPTVWVLHAVFFDDQLDVQKSLRQAFTPASIATYALFAIVYPSLRIITNVQRDNSFQKATVNIAEAALGKGDTYLAGNDIVHTRDQVLPGLARLGAAVQAELHRRSAADIEMIVRQLANHPPRLVMANYRVAALPSPIRAYLANNYAHFWSNVFSYAPRVDPGQQAITVAFSGDYGIDGPAGKAVVLDGQMHEPRESVRLLRGQHAIQLVAPIRLRLQMNVPADLLDRAHLNERDFYPSVYDY